MSANQPETKGMKDWSCWEVQTLSLDAQWQNNQSMSAEEMRSLLDQYSRINNVTAMVYKMSEHLKADKFDRMTFLAFHALRALEKQREIINDVINSYTQQTIVFEKEHKL